MIRSLNQQNIFQFGTILTEKTTSRYTNHHTISLQHGSSQLFQTVAQTWLNIENGMAILSVSTDNEAFMDFYLDKPLRLHGGVWFTITPFQGNCTVQLSAHSAPRHISSRPAGDFKVYQQLQIQSLFTFFYQELEQGHLFTGEAHSVYELTYVDRGSLHSVVDGQDILLTQGDMALYGPDQWHMQYADVDVAPRIVTLTFCASGCDLTPLLNRSFPSGQKASVLLRQMLREQELMGEHSTDMIFCLLQQLLITLLRETKLPAAKAQLPHFANNENEIIRAAQQYVGTHVREKLSVPLVAKGIDVSASYLTALFHKHLQISPGEYIRRIKLQESKQMIREGEMNFTQIADALQYSTVHHFSRQFKEKFGITPSEYAKSVR